MNKIIVTGATSMIGLALIKEAINNRTEVFALDISSSPRLSKLPNSPLVTFIECDLNNLNTIDTSKLKNIDCFYHFAWLGTSKEQRDNPEIQLKNIQISLDCIKFAYSLGIKKFVGAGSQAEYGNVDNLTTPCTPVNPLISYGVAKYSVSKFGMKLCDKLGITFIWGRIFSVYGTNDNPWTMLNYVIDSLLNNNTPQLSSCEQLWNFLYEDDAGKIFYLLGKNDLPSKVYCVGSNDTRQLKQFINDLKNIINTKVEIVFSNTTPAGINPDISGLLKDIGQIEFTSFTDGIKKIIDCKEKI